MDLLLPSEYRAVSDWINWRILEIDFSVKRIIYDAELSRPCRAKSSSLGALIVVDSLESL